MSGTTSLRGSGCDGRDCQLLVAIVKVLGIVG